MNSLSRSAVAVVVLAAVVTSGCQTPPGQGLLPWPDAPCIATECHPEDQIPANFYLSDIQRKADTSRASGYLQQNKTLYDLISKAISRCGGSPNADPPVPPHPPYLTHSQHCQRVCRAWMHSFGDGPGTWGACLYELEFGH